MWRQRSYRAQRTQQWQLGNAELKRKVLLFCSDIFVKKKKLMIAAVSFVSFSFMVGPLDHGKKGSIPTIK